MEIGLSAFILGFVTAFLSVAILKIGGRYGFVVGLDHQRGPQKIHHGQIPRIGGLAVFLGLCAQSLLFHQQAPFLLFLMIAMAAPVFVVGMIEDLIAGVSARVRFLASLGAGLCFCLFTGYAITDVKLEVLAVVLAVPFLSVGLTALAVASLSNAINMIDGLNGLAAGTLIILLAAVAFVGYAIADALTAFMALAILASVAGFAVWNYPFGRVFLGDGGAYFLGALLAGIVIIIAERNAAVSPFFSLFIVIYPFYELVRSTLRRMMTRGARPFAPDNKHLHSLVFKAVAVHTDMSTTAQNAVSSAIMLLFPLITAVLAVKWFDDRGLLIIGILGFVGVYEATVMTLKAVQDTGSVASR